ncbi:MAG TPA: rubrerythrin family protein [Clostridia bacterium]|nr:rubrerythrin family protein [Clostridia bacterium]
MSTPSVSPNTAVTIQNLQAAFNGESNAAAKYALFASKAGEEGYARVASLFRAASRAEQIHAANHARVLEKLGAKPEAKIETPEVKSTAENLKCAIAGEEYERDVMYPGFIREAKAQNNSAALRTFQFALEAEAEHASLYTVALNSLEQQRTATAFYVCVVCGYTTADAELVRCAICKAPREKFESII